MAVSGRRFHFPKRGVDIKKDFSSIVQQPLVVQSLHIIEASRSHSDTPHSVGLLSPTQRPLLENTQHSGETDIHDLGGIRTSNPSKRTVADPRLGTRLLRLARMILRKHCNWGLGAEDSVSCLVLTNALIKLGYTTMENFWTDWVDVSFYRTFLRRISCMTNYTNRSVGYNRHL